jgi:hypothetical protein
MPSKLKACIRLDDEAAKSETSPHLYVGEGTGQKLGLIREEVQSPLWVQLAAE